MNNWIYIFVMAFTTFLIRVLPLTLIRRQIKNRFLKSFLTYVPYVTLSVMTFPAIIQACSNPYAGMAAFAVGVIAAWKKLSMFIVAALCCITVFIVEMVL